MITTTITGTVMARGIRMRVTMMINGSIAGNYDYHIFRPTAGHLGGAKERRLGWGNCGLPPGQAKKYGCQTYVYQGTQYYYYQDDAGRMVVRRPTVHIDINIP